MAHTNIHKRQAYVQAIIDSGERIDWQMRKKIAEMFSCSPSAIAADYQTLATRKLGHGSFHLTPNLRKEIYNRDGKVCQYCSSDDARRYVIDHIIPASMGGISQPFNLVVACASCNTKKRKQVWTPKNLAAITGNNQQWRDLIISKV